MDQVNVQEIQIHFINGEGGLIGFASCVIDGRWFISNLGIYTRADGSGYRITYPTKILKNNQSLQLFNPITKEAGSCIESAVTAAIKDLI